MKEAAVFGEVLRATCGDHLVAEGERVLLQPGHQIDALDPATRAAFAAEQGGSAGK